MANNSKVRTPFQRGVEAPITNRKPFGTFDRNSAPSVSKPGRSNVLPLKFTDTSPSLRASGKAPIRTPMDAGMKGKK